MKNRLFRLGGGAGVGSFIIVLDNNTITNPEALRIRQSYDCGESLYLSIIDEVTEEALLPLTGYVDEQDILHLSGRDFDDNKTYEIDIDEENNTVELNIVDGITMGEGTIPTEGGGGGSTYYKHDIRWDVQGDPDKRICFSFISISSESINTNVKMRTLLSNKPHILDNMACYYEDDVSENYLAGPITWASASSSSVTVQMFSPNSSYHTEEWTFTNAPSDTVTEL